MYFYVNKIIQNNSKIDYIIIVIISLFDIEFNLLI